MAEDLGQDYQCFNEKRLQCAEEPNVPSLANGLKSLRGNAGTAREEENDKKG